jgi:hypothetical protein
VTAQSFSFNHEKNGIVRLHISTTRLSKTPPPMPNITPTGPLWFLTDHPSTYSHPSVHSSHPPSIPSSLPPPTHFSSIPLPFPPHRHPHTHAHASHTHTDFTHSHTHTIHGYRHTPQPPGPFYSFMILLSLSLSLSLSFSTLYFQSTLPYCSTHLVSRLHTHPIPTSSLPFKPILAHTYFIHTYYLLSQVLWRLLSSYSDSLPLFHSSSVYTHTYIHTYIHTHIHTHTYTTHTPSRPLKPLNPHMPAITSILLTRLHLHPTKLPSRPSARITSLSSCSYSTLFLSLFLFNSLGARTT